MGIAAHFESTAVGNRRADDAGESAGITRREPRRILMLEAVGETASGDAAVTIHNISTTGMLLETRSALAPGESLNLELPQVGATRARVVWASASLYGCAFDAPLSQAALSAAQLRSAVVESPRVEPAPPPQTAASVLRGDSASDATLGLRIQRLRKARALTLSELARRMGVSKPTVWAWEQGKARPVESRFEALSEVLGVSLEELLPSGEDPALQDIVARARRQIASAYKTTEERVRIMIDL